MTEEYVDPLISGFLSYLLEVRRLKPRSVIDIKCTLKKAMEYLECSHPDMRLWQVGLDEYLGWIGHERDQGKSVHSIQKQLSHVRGFLDYAWRNGRVDRNVLDGFNLKDKGRVIPPRALTMEEAARLIDGLSSRNRVARRDRMMILLLYGCGLRTMELCSLNVQDVDIERQELFVRRGKGDIQRRIPVNDVVWTELLAYLQERGGKQGALFRTETKNRRVNEHAVRRVVHDAVIRAGLEEGITAKTLRHTFATHLMDAGVDVGIIASLMGHRSPRETGVYLHALENSKKNAIHHIMMDKDSEEGTQE